MFYQSVCHFHLTIHSNSLHQSVCHFHLTIHSNSLHQSVCHFHLTIHSNSLHQSVCHFHLIIHSVSVISVLVSLPNDSYASSPEIDFCHSSLPVTLHPLFFKFKDCMFIWGLFLLQGLFIFHWIPCSVSSSRFYSYKRKVSVDEWNESNSSSNALGIHCWNIIFTDLPVCGWSWWLISVQILLSLL